MKLIEICKYKRKNYHIIKLNGSSRISTYIILRIVFEVKMYVRAYTTLKEAIEYVNNL